MAKLGLYEQAVWVVAVNENGLFGGYAAGIDGRMFVYTRLDEAKKLLDGLTNASKSA